MKSDCIAKELLVNAAAAIAIATIAAAITAAVVATIHFHSRPPFLQI
jgi:hypothetical protein